MEKNYFFLGEANCFIDAIITCIISYIRIYQKNFSYDIEFLVLETELSY